MIFDATLSGYSISVVSDTDTNTVRWDDGTGSPSRNDYQELPLCFGKIVGITTKPRPDAFMLIFLERGVYAMDREGSHSFSFRPLIVE